MHVKDMEHYVVVYEEIIEKRGFKRRDEPRQETDVDEKKGESSTIQERDDPKEYCEQKKKVTTPISIEELFKPRPLKAGVHKSEIRRVLLYGNPGSGKTCIGKGIAHKWALGEILQEFKAIYVVPIRRLNIAEDKGLRGKGLEEVVAKMCFKQRSDAEFEELKNQVNDDLDTSSTLVVLDGLDEADNDEDARNILSGTEKNECKILILTRPYNLRGIQTKVDCQFECLGFNDQQLKNYIIKELQRDESSRLIRYLQQDRGMWESAHIPVTAHILCSLSKERGNPIEDRGRRASMYQIYSNMTNFVWKRFKERPGTAEVDKDIVFSDLEVIAFEALRSGQILIEQSIVEGHTTSTNTTAIFKESGFLLLVLEGEHYQFPHLTFEEYFAGRFIASSLNKKGSIEESRALEFIQKGKYNEKHNLTISFAMHAFAKGGNKSALQEMLSVVDEQPVEVLGIQHFLLRMRVLEATLEETKEADLDDLLNDEQAIKLAEGARQLLERTIDDVLIREMLVNEFKQLSSVSRGFPQILDKTVDEVKKMLGCSHVLTWMDIAKIKDVVKLTRHSPKQRDTIIRFIMQLVENPNGSSTLKKYMRRLSSIAGQMPRHADDIVPMLTNKCGDEDSEVREEAIKAIGRLVAAAPEHTGEVLSTLANGCGDENSKVREEAIKAIGRLVAAVPEHTGEALPTLVDGCGDKDFFVRQAAIEAIGRVIAVSSQHNSEFLSMLAIKMLAIGDSFEEDDDWEVHDTFVEIIDRVAAAATKHASEVISLLVEACEDEEKYVHWSAAIEAISRVVATTPKHAGEVLPTLVKGCSEKRFFGVRIEAIKAISCVVAAAPKHAGEVLPMLVKVCGDDKLPLVRGETISVLGGIVRLAPNHTGEVLPKLVKACDDEQHCVRSKAVLAICGFVVAEPQRADELFPIIKKCFSDPNSEVRLYAMLRIHDVVAAAPDLAGEVFPLLVKASDDKEECVRWPAMQALGFVVAETPQHAGEVISLLVEGCEDEEPVRYTAMEAIGRVIAVTP